MPVARTKSCTRHLPRMKGRKLWRLAKQTKKVRTKEFVDLLPRSSHWSKEWPTQYVLDPLVGPARLVGITWTRRRVYERWTTDEGETWDHSWRPFMNRGLPEGLYWRLQSLTFTTEKVFEEWKVDYGFMPQ